MRTLHKNAVYSVNHVMMIGNLLSEGELSCLADTFMQQIVYTINHVM